MSEAVKKEVVSWIKTIVFAVVIALMITQGIIVNAEVPTGSMEDTIEPKDRIVANRLAYTFHDPDRYDIVVFRYPDDPSILYVKRVIGLPGDVVTIKDGEVFINDSEEALPNDFVKGIPMGNFGPYVVPEEHYFMLGDNRNNSQDSREWKNKYVYKKEILGKVVFRYFPQMKVY